MENNKMARENYPPELKDCIRYIFRTYFDTEPAPFFENYFRERIPEEERLGTARVMQRVLDRLSKSNALPTREALYSQIFDLANYSYGEWWFKIRDLPSSQKKKELTEDSQFIDRIAFLVSLKFNILVRGVRQGKLHISSLSPYSPINTDLKALLMLMINLNSPLAKNDPNKSLVFDLFDRILRKAHGTLKMLSMGLGNDAYASWRTLHEAECILSLLVKDGDALERVYVQHIVYNNAFRGTIADTAKSDAIFGQMKERMKEYGLKSKDIKKFIEYGWLYSSSAYLRLSRDSELFRKYAVPLERNKDEVTRFVLGKGPAKDSLDYADFQRDKVELLTWDHDRLKDFKLNFRDGIENLAGLTRYSEWYETASEVTHSSPVFFYANDQFFFDLSTVALYQLSLRVARLYVKTMEKSFSSSPQTAGMVNVLLNECTFMCRDQRQRFKQIYGIKVLDEDDGMNDMADMESGPYGVTKPGPILKEEEDKG